MSVFTLLHVHVFLPAGWILTNVKFSTFLHFYQLIKRKFGEIADYKKLRLEIGVDINGQCKT